MKLLNISKVEEDRYTVESLPCPDCNSTLGVSIRGAYLYRYNQGAHITEVLPDLSPADRERFITGICPICWDKLFPIDEDEE